MNRLIKLISLIFLSTSIYYIYNYTNNSKYVITNLGDAVSINNNSYIINYKKYKEKTNRKVITNNDYANKRQNISQLLLLIKNTSKIKKIISESDIIIITLGYNDLLYELSINDKQQSTSKKLKMIKKDYNELIEEITKYYHKDIIVIGYYEKRKDISKETKELNKILKSNRKVNYIDTYYLINNNQKYYDNLHNKSLNKAGYNEITKKIISKTLEIS